MVCMKVVKLVEKFRSEVLLEGVALIRLYDFKQTVMR